MSRPNFDRLAPPPRPLGLGLRLYALFADPLGQVGWVLVAFSSIFVWVFVMNSDFTSWFVFRGDPPTTLGKITAVAATGAKENKARVWAVSYSFRAGEGAPRQGTSYVTGTAPAVGATVTVEFVEERPEVSRIQGMRRALFGPGAIMVLIFPGFGLLLAGLSLHFRRRTLRLLAFGKVAAGTLVGRERTNVTVNKRAVMTLTFEYTADGQRHRTVARSSTPEELTDESRETLVYLPEEPAQAVLVDDLPKGVMADEAGQLQLGRPGAAVLALLLPLLVVLSHGACVVFRSTR